MAGFTLKAADVELRETNGCRKNCIDILGGPIRGGEFVLFEGGKAATTVGRIASLEDRRDTEQEELDKSQQPQGDRRQRLALLRVFNVVERKQLDSRKCNQVPATLKEVEMMNNCCWAPTKAIASVAFTFHVESIQAGKHECGGIDNAFTIRNEQCADGTLAPMQEATFNPFCVCFGKAHESYSNRVWNGVAAAKELCFEALSGEGMWDGRNKHIHMIGANLELFQCLQRKMLSQSKQSEPIQKQCNYRRAKKRMNADLSVSNKRLKTAVQLVRIVEEPHLDVARRVLGSAFGVAITKPTPTLKQMTEQKVSDTAHLRETDMVRIVTCPQDDHDIDTSKDATPCPVLSCNVGPSFDEREQESIDRLKRAKTCPFPGLELECQQSETGVTDLHIHVTFKKLLGKSPTVRKAQRGGHLTQAKASQNN